MLWKKKTRKEPQAPARVKAAVAQVKAAPKPVKPVPATPKLWTAPAPRPAQKAASEPAPAPAPAAAPAPKPAPAQVSAYGVGPCDAADEAALHAAEQVFDHLQARVRAFQESLPENYELGIQLANFGGERALHVRDMGFRNPSIIEFYGLLDGDRQVAVVQHVSQLNFLLIAVPPAVEDHPYRIGFATDLGGPVVG